MKANSLPEGFNDNVAVYFNKLIEVLELEFDSYEAKAQWAKDHIKNKTMYGKAAVKYALDNA